MKKENITFKKGGEYLMKAIKIISLALTAFVISAFGKPAMAVKPLEVTPTPNPLCQPVGDKFVLCHHNPAQTITHEFNNLNSCENHLGTPHNGSTYDTAGYCSAPPNVPEFGLITGIGAAITSIGAFVALKRKQMIG